MVAITVILAAVIAAFVFGLAGTTGSSKNVGLTVAKNSTNAFDVTVQGGTDLPSVTGLNWSFGNNTQHSFTTSPPNVGDRFTALVGDNTGDKFIIIGKFNDGSTQVLFDRQY